MATPKYVGPILFKVKHHEKGETLLFNPSTLFPFLVHKLYLGSFLTPRLSFVIIFMEFVFIVPLYFDLYRCLWSYK